MRKPFDELQHRGKKLNKHALTHLQNFFGDFAGFFQLHKIKKHSFRSNISHHIKKAHHHIRTHHKKYIGGILGGFAVIKMVLLFMGFFGILLHMNTSAVYVAVDTTFATKEPVGFNAQVSAMAVQSDGKIIMGGSFTTYRGVSKNYIIRLASNGTIDTGFNIGIGLNSSVMAIAIETGGKIILGGNFTSYSGTSVNRIIRLYSSGIIDTGFSIGAGCNDVVNAIAIDTGGNIILGGAFGTYSGAVTTGIVRLTNNGLRDTSFVIGGFSGIVNALQIETGGKIIVGGTFNLYSGAATTGIVRLTNTGLKDPSFVVGLSITGAVNALDIQDDGKIIAGGSFWTYSGVAAAKIIRLTNTGFKDPSFVIGGGFNSDVNSITLQNDGKIIVGGSFNSYSGTTSSDIARLNTSGTIDTSFAIGGGFNSTVMALATGNNNTILVGGSFTTYNGTGINYVINLDTSGNINTGFVIGFGFSSNIAALVRQSDGKIVVGGSFVTYSGGINKYIVRLASNGTIDTSLIGGGFNSAVTALALETGGKIIAGGSFTNYSGTTINRIARLTTTGVLDTTFVIGAGFNSTVNAIAIQSDGKIVVGGAFTTYSGATVNYITRLTSTGVRDTTFIGSGFSALVYALAIQPDQKIIVGGNFTSYSGTARNSIVRLNTNGTIDTGFYIGTGFGGSVNALTLQSDGKIVAGGTFANYSGAVANRLIRLNTNGSIDTGFFTGAGANSTVAALAIQTDNKILAGGSFSTYSGVSAAYILRLNTSGTMDLSFTIGVGLNNAVAAILTGDNNSVFIGGSFTLFNGGINGATAGYLALLYTDYTPPSTPTLVSPGSGTTSYASTGYLIWSASTDTGVGMSGYIYQISTGTTFATFWKSGSIATTGIYLTGLTNGTYYRKIAAVDNGPNTGARSETGNFIINLCGTWDDNQFLNQSFRNSNPSNDKIICALFADGNGGTNRSIYTQNWSGTNCSINSMVTTGITAGTDKIPAAVAANTIYVLESGEYIFSATRAMAVCSAIVGKGVVKISANYATNTRLITSTKQYNILDNIELNRSGTVGGTSTDVIYLNASDSFTANDIAIYNGYNGFYDLSYAAVSIYNSRIYNNSNHGIYLTSSTGLFLINNSQIYNNTGVGIYFFGISSGATNNNQVYNNGSYGIIFYSSKRGITNNSQIYNNSSYGIYFSGSISGAINNLRSYNNNNYGAYMTASTGTTYYGNNNLFGNSGYNISGTVAHLITGTTNTLGRNTGTIDQTKTISRDYITNPINNVNNYLLSRSGSFITIRGNKGLLATSGMQYSYGSGVLNQIQPVVYSGGTLITGGLFSGTQFIGSSVSDITGTLLGINTFNASNGTIVTGTASSPATHYNIFGDLSGFKYGVDSNTTTGITFSGGITTGKVITQIYDPTNYFAMHFQLIANIDRVPPSIPTLISPTSGQSVSSATVNLLRSGAVDTGIGISGYTYQVSIDPAFTTSITTSGRTITTGVAIISLTNNTYYRRVSAYDLAGNTGTRSTGRKFILSIITDTTPPSIPALLSPSSGQAFNTGSINLLRSGAIDTGAGISGYIYQVSTGINFDSFIISGAKTTTGVSLLGFTDGRYYRRVYAVDLAGNTGARSTGWTFTVDIIPPLVSTGYISLGTTGTYGGNMYYMGTINIRANVSDGFGGLSGTTCMYTAGGTRNTATYNTTYCEATIVPITDINIRFRISDNAGNTTTGATGTYYYDSIAPDSILLSPTSGQALNTGNINLLRSGIIDTGVGLSGYIRQVSTGANFTTLINSGNRFTTGITLNGLTNNRYYRRIYAFDRGGNTGARTSGWSFTVDTIPPTFSGVVTGGAYIRAIPFDFYDLNLSGAVLSGFGESSFYSGDFHTGLLSLGDGDYTLTIYDRAGNSTGATFSVHSSIMGFSGITSGGAYTGVTITYTFTGHAEVCWMSGVIISGLNNSYVSGDYTSGYLSKTRTFNREGRFSFDMYENDADRTGVTFTIDHTAPTQTTLNSPLIATYVDTGNLSLIWNAAIDTGIGISGYIYQVSTGADFSTFIISGTKYTTGVSLNNFTDGTYYRRVYAFDMVGNIGGRSWNWNFTVQKERATLRDFYNATNGSGWITKDNWLDTGASVCIWYGISCDGTGNVRQINLPNNNLSGSLSGLNNLVGLQYLRLGTNSLSSITTGALSGLPNLQILHLATNKLSTLRSGNFISLSTLSQLNLSDNNISSLTTGVFAGLNSLTYLRIGSNQLSFIASGILPATLTNLYVDRNQFTSIGNIKLAGINLTDLDMSLNEIAAIQHNDLPNSLINLSLYSNNISSLSGFDFSGPTGLQNLDIGGNQITQIISGELPTTLTTLGLYSQNITSLKNYDFHGLPNLQTLDIAANHIMHIYSGELPATLTYLGLVNNYIVSLDNYDINQCPNLTNIDIEFNELSFLPDGIFSGLAYLTQLYLNDNRLTDLQSGLFQGITDITSLQIYNNPILAIGSDAFDTLTNIQPPGVSPSCNTNGTEAISFPLSSSYSTVNTDHNYCAAIYDTDPTNFANELIAKSYVLSGSYYYGNYAISYNNSHTDPKIFAPLIMQSYTYSFFTGAYILDEHPVEIQYEFGTTITQNGDRFTGVLHSPVLFPTGNVPGMDNTTTLMRFGNLKNRIDFSDPITIRMPVPGKTHGDMVDIYSSDEENIYNVNGPHRNFETNVTVADIGGYPYVEFTTNHASRRTIGTPNVCASVTDIPYSECVALAALYTSTNGSGWYNSTNRGSRYAADWYGISLSSGHVRRIDLRVNNLSGVISSGFTMLNDLQIMALNDNSISGIETGAFDGFTNLIGREMAGNLLTYLPAGVFDTIPNAQWIYLNGNKFTTLSTGLFSALSLVTDLDLGDNQIVSLPSEVFDGLSNLTNLGLYNNQLTSINSGIFNGLSSLQGLGLSDNLISSIDTGTFDPIPGLVNLYLDNNQLSTIGSGAFDGLSSLGYLSLNNNQINNISANAFTPLTSLTELYLHFNQIDHLLTGIFDTLTNTITLYLSFNKIGNLPSGIFNNLTSLTYLNLGYNRLVFLPSNIFDTLASLAELDLPGNQLTTLPIDIFSGLSNINYLVLNNNYFDTIPTNIFNQLPGLQYLFLSDNSFTKTDSILRDIPTSLVYLDISKNPITSVETGSFGGFGSLGNLYIAPSCNTSGYNALSYGSRGATTDNNYCVAIPDTNTGNFTTELTNKGYVWDAGLSAYMGNYPISFNNPNTTNEFLEKTIMVSYTYNVYSGGFYIDPVPAGVVYNASTKILNNDGSAFTNVLQSPVLFATGYVPDMTGVSVLMRFGDPTIKRISFDTPVTIMLPVLDKTTGDIVRIYSSTEESIYGPNGPRRGFEFTGEVIDYAGNPYVQITTKHAGRRTVGTRWFDCTTITDIPQRECEALVALYDNTNGPNRGDRTNRLTGTLADDRYGIMVNTTGGYVEQINLHHNKLDGSIPSEIANLTGMILLAVQDNKIRSIPPEIGQLTSLQGLFINSNGISSLPDEIGNLSNLIALFAGGNNISTVPGSITGLVNLMYLDLGGTVANILLTQTYPGGNNITSLPDFYLPNLIYLDVSQNSLSELPLGLGDNNSLTFLLVNNNNLTDLPASIGNLANLSTLFAGGNALSTIPSEISGMNNLQSLDLGGILINKSLGNYLHAPLPGGNQITSVPDLSLAALTDLDLSQNLLTATGMFSVGNSSLPSLHTLLLNNNNFSYLPDDLGKLGTVTALTLGGNQLTGLPSTMNNMTNLNVFDIGGDLTNELRGSALPGGNLFTSLPNDLRGLTSLTDLGLSQNLFVSLPPDIANLTNLNRLYLNNNFLINIPEEVTGLTNLYDNGGVRADINCIYMPSLSSTLISFLDLKIGNSLWQTSINPACSSDNIPPSRVDIVSPTSGTTTTRSQVDFLWNPSEDTGSGIYGYVGQLSTGASFTSVITSGFTTNTGRSLTGLTNGTYYRRVYAIDNIGNTGLRSSGWSFTVNIIPPVVTFTGSNPADNIRIRTNSFTGQLDITEAYLTQFKRIRNGVNYSLYDSGLVFMANFDNVSSLGESNGVATDVSSYGANIAGYGGVTRTGNGRRNGSYAFNGTDGQFIITNNDRINIAGSNITLSAWIKINTCPTTFNLLLHKEAQYSLSLQNNCTITYADSSNRSYTNFGYKDIGITTGVWNYIVATKDSSNFVSLYRNGVYQTGKTFGSTITQNNYDLIIGNYQSASYYFSGWMDEPRIYNRTLSSGEIAQQYYSNLNKYDTNKWNFIIFQTGLFTDGIFRYTGFVSNFDSLSITTGRNIGRDTTNPGVPTLLSPTSGQAFTTGNITLLRSGSVDTGSGISGYIYQVSTGINFNSFILSGFTTTTGIALNNLNANTYYRRVYAIDTVGNTGGRSTGWNFMVDFTPPTVIFTGLNPIDNARINSNSFTGQLNITELNLNQFKRTRSGIDYSIYDSSLMLMMNFDKVSALSETDGLIKDMSLSGNIGSGYGGVTRTGNGRWSGAYIGNGVDSRIELANKTGFQRTTFTISARVKPSNAGLFGIFSTFYFKGTANYFGYTLRLSPTNQITFISVAGGGLTVNEQQLGSIVDTGIRTHVVVTFDGVTSKSSIYKNGVYDTGKVQTTPLFDSTQYHADIGAVDAAGTAFSSYFSGMIDELRIYNRVLSSGEIATLYYSNLNKYDTNKWNFIIFQTGLFTDGIVRYTGFVSNFDSLSVTTGRNIGRDTTNPGVPTLLSPTSGQAFTTGNITLLRSGSVDTGSGISGYIYQVSTDSAFTTFITSGTKTTTGISLINFTDGTYYRRIYAIDTVGNTGGRSTGWNFVVNTNSFCASRWNNDNFITGGFRAGNPSTGNIICALYGDGSGGIDKTAYTQNRSGGSNCATGSMSITGLSAGTNKIPTTLTDNTIYVLGSGVYIQSATVNIGTCTAIIGTGTVIIQANYAGTTNLLASASKSRIILDNLLVDRNYKGNASANAIYITTSPSVTINNIQAYSGYRGIYFYSSSNYGTISNSQIYNNGPYGIHIYMSSYPNINNSQTYNNVGYGIYSYNSTPETINNSQSYNNGGAGIYFDTNGRSNVNNSQSYNNGGPGIAFTNSSSYGAVNNSQSYNNGTYGIQFSFAYYGTVNNSQIYNNGSYGIRYDTTAYSGVVNNTRIYNNNSYGIYVDSAVRAPKYYGDNKLFGNTDGGIRGVGDVFSTGTSSSLGRSNGTIDTTPTMSRDYITNPINSSNQYLLSRSGTFTSLRGRNTTYTATPGMQYSYGSEIITQIQPVILSGTTLINSGTYTTGNYIGSSVSRITGDIDIPVRNLLNITVTGIVNSPATRYSIFGDLASFNYGIAGNTSTGITITPGTNPVRVITQLYDPVNYFATHFQHLAKIDAPTLISPINGMGFTTGAITLLWDGGTMNTGTWSSGYVYQVSTDSGFTSFIASGTTTTTGISLNGFTEGTYYRRVFAIDPAGNTGLAVSSYFAIASCSGRNNDQFVDSGFRASNPSNAKIICAFFGDGNGGTDKTAYTSGRNTNTCAIGNITVTGVIAGTNTLPAIGQDNTIYVLLSGWTNRYYLSSQRSLGSCTAIVGSVFDNANLPIIDGTSMTVSSQSMLVGSVKNNIILDSINVYKGSTSTANASAIMLSSTNAFTLHNIYGFASNYGIYIVASKYGTINSGWTNGNNNIGVYISSSTQMTISNFISDFSNSHGISISSSSGIIIDSCKVNGNARDGIYFSSSTGISINNTQTYENGGASTQKAGIDITSSSNININNSQSYNNFYFGFRCMQSDHVTINNAQAYQNSQNGIRGDTITEVNINNTQVYNNATDGINIGGGTNFTINNSQVYNNTSNGIISSNTMSGLSINNIQSYNNGNYGVYTTTTGKYYGINKIFANTSGSIGGTTGIFMTGTTNTVGWSTGSIDSTQTLSRDYLTNVLDIMDYYPPLLSWSGTFDTFRGQNLGFIDANGEKYSYGSGVLTQIQPVIYSGTTLVTGGTFTSNNFIGSSVAKLTGSLLGINTYNGINSIVTGIANSPVTLYNIFGDITSFKYAVTSNTSTGITFSGGLVTGKVITQFYNPTNYFAMHFQSIANIDSTPPTVSTGYISLGTTGANGGNIYFKGTINIRGDVSDTMGLSGATCMYTTGGSRNTATYNTTYCEATNLTPTSNINIRFKIADIAGNVTTGATGAYIYDATNPSIATALSPTSGTIANIGTINLLRTGSIETGIGLSGYVWQLASNGTFTTIVNSGIVTTTGKTITGLADNIYYWRVYGFDSLGNTGTWNSGWSFTVDTIIDCASRWNNDNFITGGFWTAGTPTRENIICALFGTGPGDTTAYTQNWSGWNTTQCSGAQLAVIETTSLPGYMTGNIIYILTGATSSITNNASRVLDDCNAVISKHSSGTTFYSTVAMSFAMMGLNTNKRYGIVDNIMLDGYNNGAGSNHTKNQYGFGANSGSLNVTINNTKAYNNVYGFAIYASKVTLNNDKAYDNDYHGFLISNASYVTINNSESYNNILHGIIILNNATYNSINNTQSYNNGSNYCGIDIYSGQNNSINNSQIYNNGYGLCIYSANNVMNNIDIYNNSNATRFNPGGGLSYYGQNNIFNNDTRTILGSGTMGTGISSLGWATGSLITGGTMSRDYVSNPKNASGNYLFSWTDTWIGIRTYTGKYDSGSITTIESYGSGIRTQAQPVLYSGGVLITGNKFDTTRYIGSDVIKVTGNVLGIVLYNTGTLTITGTSSSPWVNTYDVFGDIISYKTGVTINTSTGITLITGLAVNRIVTQFYYPNTYFATHFQATAFVDTLGPPAPILLSPTSGQVLNTGNTILLRSGSVDAGIGLSGYIYQVSTGSSFSTFITSGTKTTTGISLTGLTDGTYYRRVYAFDTLGNTGTRSSGWNFTITLNMAPVLIFTGSTPASGTTITTNSFTGQVQITEIDLTGVTWIRSGVTTTYTGDLLANYPANFSLLSAGLRQFSLRKIVTQNGIYTLKVCGQDIPGLTGCTEERTIIFSIPPPTIFAPGSGLAFNNGIVTRSFDQTISGQFMTGYFGITDTIGSDSGYYTTISSTNLLGMYYTIPSSKVSILASGINILGGDTNPLVYIPAGLQNYTALSGSVNYIRRNTQANSGVIGTYGNQPRIKVDIPAFQNEDSYTATLTITLYQL